MNLWTTLAAFTAAFSFILTKMVIIWLGNRLVDTPSDRSSHNKPTPRGGGLAIAMSCAITYSFLWIYAPEQAPDFLLIALPIAMAILGLIDDFINLKIQLRLIVQLVFATIGIQHYLLETSWSLLNITLVSVPLILALVWSTNLYNFMDGINGIAALQAISTCVAMGSILLYCNVDTEAATLLLIVGFSCTGFLYWNFPTAKIFMGDTGSLFLGFCFGLLAIKTSFDSLKIAVAWLIVMALFICDASYTLFIRFISGQKFYLPHRTHSYQKLAVQLGSHGKASLSALAMNMLWLYPIAFLTVSTAIHPMLALILAYSPLIIVSMKFKAGITS
ncbi:glycosyl transferase [Cellvibrio sp. KY-GH-1]|uniref:MraY family glycosyltransferase n=1 Tax=Cellvibrio sp. KY-GH-1 TaxID=2303332 RepID=UPI001248FA00|nr:glycosyltransferase family 4 protein [Cellvibrio sp. KY-GH-1]QEY15077.1 glycosyl transferase [Cellvibrio sp. KY-GH-1]